MNKKKFTYNTQEFEVNLRSQADKSIFKEIFELGEYKPALPAIRSAKELIIDAGAQAGFFILYCRAYNPDVLIYGIEPAEDNLEMIRHHLEDNHIKKVEIFPGVLSDQTGLADLYLSQDTHNHSLYKNLVNNIKKKIKIKTWAIADFCHENKIKEISLLKLDIEGAEYKALQSLKKSDWAKIKAVFLEYHDFSEYNHQYLLKLFKDNKYNCLIIPSKFDQKLGFILAVK